MIELNKFTFIISFLYFVMFLNQVKSAGISKSLGDTLMKSLTANVTTKAIDYDITELITAYGYVAETHQVQTSDGYILTLNRIPNNGPVVLLIPGVANSADDFFTLGPEKALGYLLANDGYDVWIGNPRGTKYSRHHIRLSTTERAFWDFSFHEIGVFDIPAIIDYALDKSNCCQLTYIGHSQGTTAFFVMASELPEYNDKVSLMVSMATVTWLHHARTPVFAALVPLRNLAYTIADTLHLYEVLPYDAFWRFVTGRLCPSSRFAMDVCAAVLFTAYGFDYGQLNYTQLPVQIGHLPGGVSVKQLLHFAQLIASRNFQQFDHNSTTMNNQVYGMATPPQYAVENITAPVAIMYGDNDWISSFQDVQILTSKLPNVKEIYRINNLEFNHQDFLWAKDAKQLVYTKIMQLIKECQK